MAETAIQIFADLTNRALVVSQKGGPVTLPNPYHQEKLYISVQPLLKNPTGNDTQPYTVVDGAEYALSVAVFKSSDASTLAGPLSSWSVDGTAKAGVLELNTAAMATAMTGQTSVAAIIEFQFTGSSGRFTIQQPITIKKQYIVSGTPAALPVAEYVTLAEFEARAVKYSGNAPGRTIALRNAADDAEVILGCDSEGGFTTDSGD